MRKKVIGILFVLLILISVVGCGNNITAKDAVSEYLNMYQKENDEVVKQLDEFIDREDLTDTQKDIYKRVLMKEYSTLSYDITSEKYDGDMAYVTANITVLDLYKAQENARNYYNDHTEEFNDDNGEYDKDLFIDYKLNQMMMVTDTVTYSIELKVEKNNNNWEVIQPSDEVLKKIHGIYDYEE